MWRFQAMCVLMVMFTSCFVWSDVLTQKLFESFGVPACVRPTRLSKKVLIWGRRPSPSMIGANPEDSEDVDVKLDIAVTENGTPENHGETIDHHAEEAGSRKCGQLLVAATVC
jgi:hypothetical protein